MSSTARVFDDTRRVALATQESDRTLGPLETSGCSHGLLYSFRYEWPKGSGGPRDGHCVVVDNKCLDCALQLWLRPGRRIQG